MSNGRIQDRFVGREDILKAFAEMLNDPYGERRLEYIWGEGGIGKTWLIKEMLALVPGSDHNYLVPENLNDPNVAQEYIIDMYTTGNQHVEGAMAAVIARLAPLLQDTTLKFSSYEKAHKELLIARQTVGYSSEGIEEKLEALQEAFRLDLSAIVKERPVVLAFDTFEHVHNTPVEEWVMSEEGLQMPGLICIVASRQSNPQNPEQPQIGGLSDKEARSLYAYYRRDTVSWSDDSESPSDEIISKLNKSAAGNPLLLGMAFSWVTPSELKDLSQLQNEELKKKIADWFQPSDPGHPIQWVEKPKTIAQILVLIAYLNRRFSKSFLQLLIDGGFVSGDIDHIWQKLQHDDFFFVKKRPDEQLQLHDILAEMLRIYVLPTAFDDLTGQQLKDFADLVVDWYGGLIEQAQSDDDQHTFRVEQLAYALRLDILNDLDRNPEIRHTEEGRQLKRLLSPDYVKGKELLREFQRLRSDTLDRLIIHTLKPDVLYQFPDTEKYEFASMLGNVARQIHDLAQARKFWNIAVTAAEEMDVPERQIKAMIGLHNSTWQDDNERSLEILREALKLSQQHNDKLSADVLYEMGFTYRQKELLDQAIKWYDKALKMARRHKAVAITPTILNDMGFALLLTGEYQRAKAMIQVAAQLRERNRDKLREQVDSWQKQGEESDNSQARDRYHDLRSRWQEAVLKVGMSYNTLGQAHRYTGVMDRATGYYGEALSIFYDKEINNSYWQAQGLRERGDAHRQLAYNLFNQDRLKSSLEYDKQAEEDIRNSLILCEDYGFSGIIAAVYRRLGRLFHDRYFRTDDPAKKVEYQGESLKYFQKGLEVVLTRGDIREELEIRAEIAFWGDDVAKQYRAKNNGDSLSAAQRDEIETQYLKPVQEALEKYKNDDRRPYHFDVFSDLLDMERAAIIFETEAFDDALVLYLKSYTGMARDPGFGAARCHRHFDHLLGNIRRLPDPNVGREWCRQFMEKWEITWMLRGEPKTVAEAHPDLYEQFRLYADMVFAFEDLAEVDEL